MQKKQTQRKSFGNIPLQQESILAKKSKTGSRVSANVDRFRDPRISITSMPRKNTEQSLQERQIILPVSREAKSSTNSKNKNLRKLYDSSLKNSPQINNCPKPTFGIDRMKKTTQSNVIEQNYQKFIEKQMVIDYEAVAPIKHDDIQRKRAKSSTSMANRASTQRHLMDLSSGKLANKNMNNRLNQVRNRKIKRVPDINQQYEKFSAHEGGHNYSLLLEHEQRFSLPMNESNSEQSSVTSEDSTVRFSKAVNAGQLLEIQPLEIDYEVVQIEVIREPSSIQYESSRETTKNNFQWGDFQAGVSMLIQIVQASWFGSFMPIFALVFFVMMSQVLNEKKDEVPKKRKQNECQLNIVQEMLNMPKTSDDPETQDQQPNTRPKIDDVASKISSQESGTRNDKKEIMVKNLSNMMVLCKISQIPKFSKTPLQNESVKSNGTQSTGRRIKMDVLDTSDDFFQKLPFYNNITTIAKYLQYNPIDKSKLQQASNDSCEIYLGSDELTQNHSIQSLLANFVSTPPLQIRRFSPHVSSSLQESSIGVGRRHNSIQLNYNNDKFMILSQFQKDMLELKVYTPYFISRSTVIEYQNQGKAPEKLSIMDILQKHFLQKKTLSKLFFKVNLNEEHKMINQYNVLNTFDHENGTLDSMQVHALFDKKKEEMEEIKEAQSDNEMDRKMSANSQNNSRIMQYKVNKSKSVKPQEEEKIEKKKLKKYATLLEKDVEIDLESDNSSICDSSSIESIVTSETSQFYGDTESLGLNDDLIRYYEFEIKQLNDTSKPGDNFSVGSMSSQNQCMTFLNINDITTLIKNHQNSCDKVYQEAIENNYSHEQMTPLNPIMNNSSIGKQRLINLYTEILRLHDESLMDQIQIERVNVGLLQKILSRRRESKVAIQQSISIEQSSKAIWYYNTNQIKRMKLLKNQLEINPHATRDMISNIWNVFWPFEHLIFKRGINIYLIQQFKLSKGQMVTDWGLYEAALFNIVQNALKYNQPNNGDVILIQTCKLMKSSKFYKGEKKYVLETQVIDSGIGISPDRQRLLFIPFFELRDRIGIIKAQNDNIGIGLSCSKEIIKRLGGDVKLKQSQQGMTIFTFKIPVSFLKNDREFHNEEQGLETSEIQDELQRFKLIGKNRLISPLIKKYLEINDFLEQEEEIGDLSQKRKKNQEAFQRVIGFQGQKIGFQTLEDITKIQEQSAASGSSYQPFQVLSHSQRSLSNILNNSQIFSAHGQQELAGEMIEEEKQPHDNLRGTNRMLSELNRIEEGQESSHSIIIRNPVERRQLSQFAFNNRISVPPVDVQSLEKFEDPVLQKVLSMTQQELLSLSNSGKREIAINILKNNQKGKVNKHVQNQNVSFQHNGLVYEDEIRDIKITGDIQQSNSSEDSDYIDFYVNMAVENQPFAQSENINHEVAHRAYWSNINGQNNVRSDIEQRNRISLPSELSIIQSKGDNEITDTNQKECCQPKILIAEDTDFSLMTVVQILQEIQPFNIVEAQNGKIAVEKYREAMQKPCSCPNKGFKLVLMDIQMPVMDGIEATKHILKMNPCSIVALTSYTGNEIKEQCLNIGMKAVYNKPVTAEALRQILGRYYN